MRLSIETYKFPAKYASKRGLNGFETLKPERRSSSPWRGSQISRRIPAKVSLKDATARTEAKVRIGVSRIPHPQDCYEEAIGVGST